MAIAKKIAYNVFFNATAKVLSTILALVGIGFITRYLGAGGFGDYATVLAFFSFFGAMGDLGLYSIATREISRVGADQERIMGNVFSLRIISSLVIFPLSFILIFFLPYSQQVKQGIIIAAAAFAFSSSYAVLNGIFQKHLAMDRVAATELIGKVIQVGIIILATTANLGFSMIIMSLLVYMIFNFVVVFWLSRRYIKFKLQIDFPYWKKFLKESLPLGISVLITFAYFKTDTIILSILKSSTEVGIYNAAYKIIENITFFPAMIVGLTLPLTSRFIFTDPKTFCQISNKTFKVFAILIIPIVIGTLFLSDGIIQLIGGTGFTASSSVLRILIFALLFIFFGNFFNNILIAGNLQKKMMIALAFCAVANIIANLILIPIYSYQGAAFTSVITEMLVVILTAYFAKKYLHYSPRLENIGGIITASLTMAIFLFLFKNLNFFILALGSTAIYFLILYFTKAITSQELRSIISKQPPQEVFSEEIIS